MWFLIVTLFPNIGPLGVLAGHSFSIVLYFFLFLKFKVKFPAYFKYLILGSLFFSLTFVVSLLVNYVQFAFSLVIGRRSCRGRVCLSGVWFFTLTRCQAGTMMV